MKQKNKYICLLAVSAVLATAGTISTEMTGHPVTFSFGMALFGIGAAGSILAAKGYTDCLLFGNEMVDKYGALYNVKRRFLGLEFDSSYLARIKKVAMQFHLSRVRYRLTGGIHPEKVSVVGQAVQRARKWISDGNYES